MIRPLIILNYHNISVHTTEEDPYCIPLDQFVNHLRLIRETSTEIIGLDETGTRASDHFVLAMTFDDGYAGHHTILPIMDEFGIRASFFPIVEYLDQPHRLASKQLAEFTERGHSVGSHGCSHNSLNELSPEDIELEFRSSKKFLSDLTGRPVSQFSLPYGDFNTRILKLGAQCGYTALLSTGLRLNALLPENNLYYRWNITNDTSLDLIKQVVSSNGNLPVTLKFKHETKQVFRRLLGRRISETLKKIV